MLRLVVIVTVGLYNLYYSTSLDKKGKKTCTTVYIYYVFMPMTKILL